MNTRRPLVLPLVKHVDRGDSYLHVVFRYPLRFEAIRTPEWAARVAGSRWSGAKVRMGMTRTGLWRVQAVLIPRPADPDAAMAAARKILARIEEP